MHCDRLAGIYEEHGSVRGFLRYQLRVAHYKVSRIPFGEIRALLPAIYDGTHLADCPYVDVLMRIRAALAPADGYAKDAAGPRNPQVRHIDNQEERRATTTTKAALRSCSLGRPTSCTSTRRC